MMECWTEGGGEMVERWWSVGLREVGRGRELGDTVLHVCVNWVLY